ncbi:hypothetical protein E1B28_002513 [Marasmius oreades]|uniref:Uncharacterized protein n=1 Tax=Marasmius oreades TaxID=181124 RepID=A0A9P7UN63_9AGAR|nr:uncharacterized protein E1B28_002513 [Marasmius oreades]KAG7086566.1 hypothetical protein E1B28_002513 [Marasmius oreades]
MGNGDLIQESPIVLVIPPSRSRFTFISIVVLLPRSCSTFPQNDLSFEFKVGNSPVCFCLGFGRKAVTPHDIHEFVPVKKRMVRRLTMTHWQS